MSTATLTRPAASSNGQHAGNDVAARRQALEENVLLLAPSLSLWRGVYRLPKNKLDVTLSGESLEDGDVTTPQAKLITDTCPCDSGGTPWKKRFQPLSSRLCAIIERFSVSFPITGVRIIPKSSGDEFMRLLDELRVVLEATVNEFIAELPDVLDQIQRKTKPAIWQAIESKIPKQADRMRAKFSIDVCPVELAGGAAHEVTRGDLATHGALVQETIRRKVDEAIESVVSIPRNELAEAVAALRDLIARDGNVTTRSFNAVNAAVEKMRNFRFAADDAILEAMNAMERQLQNVAPASLTSENAVRSGVQAALDSVIAEAANEVRTAAAVNAFGRPLRGLQMRPR